MTSSAVLAPAAVAAVVTAALAVSPGAGATPTATHDVARAHAAAAPSIRVTPRSTKRGSLVVITGRNWARSATVTLMIGPPRSEAYKVGSVRTRSDGTLRRRLRVPSSLANGRWVLLGCRRQCRVKALVNFWVTG